ncbi:putative solute carrier family 23 member 1-like [Scophthalmus maximus]|uniref:Putative solute carrier family 23 member 1-like n=1 Tax=Scophthalmus maximus TaxID=52904 RepID=A0A2U9BUG6_SCOMX|nr:putative solute carrier family 23 member 1-like [Scophthalmus maximus]
MRVGGMLAETLSDWFSGKDSDEQPKLTVDIEEPHTEALEEAADKGGDLVYSLNDRPPWYLCILLGFQHYILAFGGIIAIPLILAEPLCIRDNNAAKSQLISTIFFVSGLCTLLQTTVGTRLPILQGGTFSFITPTLAILALPKWQCPAPNAPVMLSAHLLNGTRPHLMEDPDEVWMSRMREIQGAILVASLLQIVLGFSGLVGLVLKYIGPLAIAPTINLIGLSLFIEAGKKSGGHWGIAALTVCLILLFSQYLSKVDVPMIAYKDKKWKVFQYPLFKLFSALFGMCGAWLICFLLTIFDVLPSKSTEYGFSARTDISLDAVANSPWFHVPYPGQWGMPTVSVSSVLGMMAGVLASTMESIGDYYACARLSGAPPPPTHAINRGIAVEGIGCIMAALWGTGNGTTSYSQNIAALGITKVGSRLVLQTTGILMIILGIFGKFGAVFITIPDPVIGGMFLVMFGMIAAVGISNLQYVDLNSSRNLLILGFSTFSGLVLPTWFHSNPGIIDTGIKELDQVIVVLFTTHMFIGGFFGFILDNTIPGCSLLRLPDLFTITLNTAANFVTERISSVADDSMVIWIRVCVYLLLFITLGVHSSRFDVNPVTDDISRLSVLRQNIPKDYKIPVHYVPKEEGGMCWVKLNVFYLEESLKDLAHKFGNISSNRKDISIFIQMLQELRLNMGSLEPIMYDFECHYREERWQTARYFDFVEDFLLAAQNREDSDDCNPPPCPTTPYTVTTEEYLHESPTSSREGSDCTTGCVSLPNQGARFLPEVVERILLSLLLILIVVIVFLIVWKVRSWRNEGELQQNPEEGGLSTGTEWTAPPLDETSEKYHNGRFTIFAMAENFLFG